MTEKKLDFVLQSLREKLSERPPTAMEPILRAEFRKFHAKRRARRNLWWTASGFSLATAATALLLIFTPESGGKIAGTDHRASRNTLVSSDSATGADQSRIFSPLPVAEKPVKLARDPERLRAKRRPPRDPDNGTEFVAIPYTGAFATTERLDVYRVQMPREMVAQFGLPLSASGFGSVATADVVVGNDGVARAIRFVR